MVGVQRTVFCLVIPPFSGALLPLLRTPGVRTTLGLSDVVPTALP